MSQISEDVKMKGELRIVKRNSLGEILQEVTVPNLVVTTGKTFIANRMTSVSSTTLMTGLMTYMGIGGIIQMLAGTFIPNKQYVIGYLGNAGAITDFTAFGATVSTVGTLFTCNTSSQGTGTGWASPVLTAGFFVPGQAYTIVSLGSTNFTLIGGVNTLGTTFVATGVGSGSGTAYTSQTAIAPPAITDAILNNEQLRQPLTPIAASAMVSGQTYTILTVGTPTAANWTSIGSSNGNVGTSFEKNAVAVSGSTNASVISGGTSSANTVTYGASFGPVVDGKLIVGQPYILANPGNATLAQIQAITGTSLPSYSAGYSFVAATTGPGTTSLTAGLPIALFEAGLFSTVTFGPTNSNMLCRTNYSIITKNAGDSIAITWVVTVS